MIFLGAFALRDSLRPTVRSAVKYAQAEGSMKVRMISGDHIATACSVAIKAGILTEEEQRKDHSVMHADQFEQLVGMNENE